MNQKTEKPSATGTAEGFEKLFADAPNPIIGRCLCGQEFQPSESFLITESPVLTITRVCSICADTLAHGSFAERGVLARLLLARAKGGQREN